MTSIQIQAAYFWLIMHHYMIKNSAWMQDPKFLTKWLYGRQPVSIFEKLNDRQFKIHTHMRTGDLLALQFFLLVPATSWSLVVRPRA